MTDEAHPGELGGSVAVLDVADFPIVGCPTHRRWTPKSWFPCEHPERPTDENVLFDNRCRGCLVAKMARMRREPHLRNEVSDFHYNGRKYRVTRAWLEERLHYWGAPIWPEPTA